MSISLRGQSKHRLCKIPLSGNKYITAINSKNTRKKVYQAVLKYAAFERTKQFALEYLICTLDSRNVTDDVQFLLDSNGVDGNLCNEPIAGLRNGPIASLNRIAMFVFSTFVVSRNPLTADLAKSLVDKIIQHMDDPASNFYGSFLHAVIHLFESSLICTKASYSYGIKILFESLKTYFFRCSRTDIKNTLNVLMHFLRDTTEMPMLSMETNDLLHIFNLNFRILDETYIPSTLPNGIDLRGKNIILCISAI